MAMVIIDKSGHKKMIMLDKKLTTFGGTQDFDVTLNELMDCSFSVLQEQHSLKLIPVDRLSSKRYKGCWNTSFSGAEILSGEKLSITFVPGITLPPKQDIGDWDFQDLPKDPRKNDYPQRLLEFLLNATGITAGGLFHRQGGNLKTIAEKNLKMKDRSEIMLNQFLESSTDDLVVHLNFDTHTVLFEAGLNPSNFILIRSKLTEDGEIVLYLPEPEYAETVPEGILSSMLYFASHGLSLHLAYRLNKRLIVAPDDSDYYWGSSNEMIRVKKLCDKLANTDLSVVICGETGSGKEGIANYFAAKSSKKIVAVNCSAIPSNLAESVLFGHVKGSFTGAVSNQLGKVVQADGGILFLDEVGELSLEIQAKLLRFLQTGIVTPIGGSDIKVLTRVVAATHRDLKEMVEKGSLREDLYYRLCEANITLPPLRERPADIRVLATIFLEQAIEVNELDSRIFSHAALEFLANKKWAGNIRELRSLVRKVAIISENEVIGRDDIIAISGESIEVKGEFPLDLTVAKKMLVKQQIVKALKLSQQNRTKAAVLLGVTPRTLFRMMAESDVIASDKDVTPAQLTN